RSLSPAQRRNQQSARDREEGRDDNSALQQHKRSPSGNGVSIAGIGQSTRNERATRESASLVPYPWGGGPKVKSCAHVGDLLREFPPAHVCAPTGNARRSGSRCEARYVVRDSP